MINNNLNLVVQHIIQTSKFLLTEESVSVLQYFTLVLFSLGMKIKKRTKRKEISTSGMCIRKLSPGSRSLSEFFKTLLGFCSDEVLNSFLR